MLLATLLFLPAIGVESGKRRSVPSLVFELLANP